MKSRRYFLIQGAMATTALLVAKPFTSFAGRNSFFSSNGANENSIHLLHTNDLHNHLPPINHDIYSGMGGFQNTAAVISKLKNELSNVILLDAGDIFCGNIHHQNEHAKTLQLMQSVGYDAVLLGNRDYEAGTDYLQQLFENQNSSLIASNYCFNNSWLKDVHLPYKIVQKGNIKIGVIGAGIDMHRISSVKEKNHVQYKDPVKELTAIATMLKQDAKCNLVICLSHLGYQNKKTSDDVTLAAMSKHIDVIIGGHSHTFMAAPQIVLNKEQKEVIINHAGFGGIALGNMHIHFDDEGNKTKVDFNNLMIGSKDNKWMYRQNKMAMV